MLILGIDTSSPTGSVALLDNDYVISESLLNSPQNYSDKLLIEVDAVFNSSKIKFYIDDMFQGTNPVELTDVHLRLTALRRGQPPIEGPALLETCLGIIPG